MQEFEKTYELETFYGNKYTVKPYLNLYADSKNIYVGLYCKDKELGFWEPFSNVTVNTVELPYLHGTIDTNNNGEGLLDFLEANGFGKRTAAVSMSGFWAYPIFRFNEEKLREINPAVFEKYAKGHGRSKAPLDKIISDAKDRTEAAERTAGREQER